MISVGSLRAVLIDVRSTMTRETARVTRNKRQARGRGHIILTSTTSGSSMLEGYLTQLGC